MSPPSTRARLRRPSDLVVFVGPSLSHHFVRGMVECDLRGPARQGDVWRALATRPRAIALIDGIFEARPWTMHHEILAALDAGVAVFGAASTGAVRAAELHTLGMFGVGEIFRWYRDGIIVDDAEVALLHAGPEHDWRPLTVPLVNVRDVATRAAKRKVLSRTEADQLIALATRTTWDERTWSGMTAELRQLWSEETMRRWERHVRSGLPDLKASDAAACIKAAVHQLTRRHPAKVKTPGAKPPSAARRRRLVEGASRTADGGTVSGAEVLEALRNRPDAEALREAGTRRALLAGWARSLGLRPTPREVGDVEVEWFRSLGVPRGERGAFLAANGIDWAAATRLFEEVALERKLLANASRLLNDGPSDDEALSSEAVLRGAWAETVRELGAKRRGRK